MQSFRIDELEALASQGVHKAETLLGLAYFCGTGTDADYAISRGYFESAAAGGESEPLVYLAWMNCLGMGGECDMAKAEELLRGSIEAADSGDCNVQYALGMAYYLGGVPGGRDLPKSSYYLERAAMNDHRDAQCFLASMYLRGDGVPCDPAKARFLLERAAGNGSAEAAAMLRAQASEEA